MEKIVPESLATAIATLKSAKYVRSGAVFGRGLHLAYVFVRLQAGWFATPRFSSLSGALMCVSKKGLQPRLMAGVFFGFGALRLTLLHKVSLHRNPRCGL